MRTSVVRFSVVLWMGVLIQCWGTEDVDALSVSQRNTSVRRLLQSLGTYTSSEGSFEDSPSSNYEDNLARWWFIAPTGVDRFQVQFPWVDIETNWDTLSLYYCDAVESCDGDPFRTITGSYGTDLDPVGVLTIPRPVLGLLLTSDNSNTQDGFTVAWSVCGDNSVAVTEECDDGNIMPGDGCSPECLLVTCGNNVTDMDEECDDGNSQSYDGCSPDCTIECDQCGGDACTTKTTPFGMFRGFEGGFYPNSAECYWRIRGGEDLRSSSVALGFSTFNTESNYDWLTIYGCLDIACSEKDLLDQLSGGKTELERESMVYRFPTNSFLLLFESDISVSSQGFTVSWSACADGLRTGLEECDDGNLVNGDGCDDVCGIEQGWTCDGGEGELSVCRECGCETGCAVFEGVSGSLFSDRFPALESGECFWTVVQPARALVHASFRSFADLAATDQVLFRECTNTTCDEWTSSRELEAATSQEAVFSSASGIFQVRFAFAATGGANFELQWVSCGDGLRNSNAELCDDGNAVSGDGCSAACAVEEGWECAGGTVVSADRCWAAGAAPATCAAYLQADASLLVLLAFEPGAHGLEQVSGSSVSTSATPIADAARCRVGAGCLAFTNPRDLVSSSPGQYMSLGPQFLADNEGLTLAFWVYVSESQGVRSAFRLLDFANADHTHRVWVGQDGSTDQIEVGVSVRATAWTHRTTTIQPGVLAPGVWRHLAWAMTRGEVADIAAGLHFSEWHVYVDGEARPPTLRRFPAANIEFTENYVGRSTLAGDSYFSGRLDHLAVYGRCLSGPEVVRLAQDCVGSAVFLTKNLGQSEPFAAAENTLTLTLQLNTDLSAASPPITISGFAAGSRPCSGPLSGSLCAVQLSTLLPSACNASAFCAGAQASTAAWDTAAGAMLLHLCAGTAIPARQHCILSLQLTNPDSAWTLPPTPPPTTTSLPTTTALPGTPAPTTTPPPPPPPPAPEPCDPFIPCPPCCGGFFIQFSASDPSPEPPSPRSLSTSLRRAGSDAVGHFVLSFNSSWLATEEEVALAISDARGIHRGARPLLLVASAPRFEAAALGQSFPSPTWKNILLVTLQLNTALETDASQISALVLEGLDGLAAVLSVLDVDGGNLARAKLCSSELLYANTVVFRLCLGESLLPRVPYVFALVIQNPSEPQPAPSVRVRTHGTARVAPTAVARPSAQAGAGVLADALEVVDTSADAARVAQSNPLAREANSLAISFTVRRAFSASSVLVLDDVHVCASAVAGRYYPSALVQNTRHVYVHESGTLFLYWGRDQGIGFWAVSELPGTPRSQSLAYVHFNTKTQPEGLTEWQIRCENSLYKTSPTAMTSRPAGFTVSGFPRAAVHTMAGSLLINPRQQNGAASDARFYAPTDVEAVWDDSAYLVADASNNAVRRVDMITHEVSMVAGGTAGSLDGIGTIAQFRSPTGLAMISDTLALVSDLFNHRVRMIDLSTSAVTTIAGDGNVNDAKPVDGVGTLARLRKPAGIAYSRTLQLALFVDGTGHVLRRIDVAANRPATVTTLAGDVDGSAFLPGVASVDGYGTNARFVQCNAVTFSADGFTAYLLDGTFAGKVRAYDAASGYLRTLAGSGAPSSLDGIGMLASFFFAKAIAADPSGRKLYVVQDDKVRSLDLETLRVSTIAGTGAPAAKGVERDGVGLKATFEMAACAAMAPNGAHLVVCDQHRLRRLPLPTGLGFDNCSETDQSCRVSLEATDTGEEQVFCALELIEFPSDSGPPCAAPPPGCPAFLCPPCPPPVPARPPITIVHRGSATWDGVTGTLHLALCENQTIREGTSFTVSMAVPNPYVERHAASLFLQGSLTPPVRRDAMSTLDTPLAGIAGGAAPLKVAYTFYERRIGQSNPLVAQANVLTATIQVNLELTGLAGSAIQISNVFGASVPEILELLPAEEGTDWREFFCARGHGNGTAKTDATRGEVTVALCTSAVIPAAATITLAFRVTNVADAQAPPDIQCAILGGWKVRPVSMLAPGVDKRGVVLGSDVLRLVEPVFLERGVEQSTPLAGRQNTITINIMSNIDIESADDSSIDLTGLAPAFAFGTAYLVQPAATAKELAASFDHDRIFYVDSVLGTVGEYDPVADVQSTLYGSEAGDVELAGPQAIAVNVSLGVLVVADTGHHMLHTLVLASSELLDLAGNETAGFEDGTGTRALFNSPSAVELAGGYVFVADTGNHAVRRVVLETGLVETIAGGGFALAPPPPPPPPPPPVGTDPCPEMFIPCPPCCGGFFIAFSAPDPSPEEPVPQPLSVSPDPSLGPSARRLLSTEAGFVDGAASLAEFNAPKGLAVLGTSRVVVADTGNNVLRLIDIEAGTVSTLAGSLDGAAGSSDGVGTMARFSAPHGLAVTRDERFVVVADHGNQAIRIVEVESGTVTTLSSVHGGNWAASAVSASPRSVAVSGDGRSVLTVLNGRIHVLAVTPGVSVSGCGVAASIADSIASASCSVPLAAVAAAARRSSHNASVFCDADGQGGRASWNSNLGMLSTYLCPGATQRSNTRYSLSFSLENPFYNRPAAQLRLRAQGSAVFTLSELTSPTSTIGGVQDGGAPLNVIIPQFQTKQLAQSSPAAAANNTFTLRLEINVDLRGADASAITLTGMNNAVSPAVVALRRAEGGGDAETLFCTAAGGVETARWDASAWELILSVCAGKTLLAGHTYAVTFSMVNPTQVQGSPDIRIRAGGTADILASPIEKPGQTAIGVALGADPLLVLTPVFQRHAIGQKTPLASTFNRITITIQTNMDLVSLPIESDPASGSVTIQVSGLSGAVIGSEHVAVSTETDDGSAVDLFCVQNRSRLGLWDDIQSSLTLRICPGRAAFARNPYIISFELLNPSTEQSAPSVSIETYGPVRIQPTAMNPPSCTCSGSATILGVVNGADPLFVIIPFFDVSRIAQNNPLPSFNNTLTVSLLVNVDLRAEDLSKITMRGLDGAEIRPPALLFDAAAEASNPATENAASAVNLFCVGRTAGQVLWEQKNSTIVLEVCNGTRLAAGVLYVFSFSVLNPPASQDSPVVLIEATGTATVAVAAMQVPTTSVSGVPGGAAPLKVLVPAFDTRLVSQSSPLADVTNTILVELESNFDLLGQQSAAITLRGFLNAALGSASAASVSVTLAGNSVQFFCDENGINRRGTWTQSDFSLVFQICPAAVFRAGIVYDLTFTVTNPPFAQPSPNVTVEANSEREKMARAVVQKPGANLLGVVSGQEPLRVVVPAFSTMRIGQSTPVAASQNAIVVTLVSNVDLLGRDASVISVYTLQGALLEGRVPITAVSDDGGGLFCDNEGLNGAQWIPEDARMELFICEGKDLLAHVEYVFSFTVTNPPTAQDAPTIRVEAAGTASIAPVLFVADGASLLGVEGATFPLTIVVPQCLVKTLEQTTPVASANNRLVFTLRTNVELGSDPAGSTIIISGLVGGTSAERQVQLFAVDGDPDAVNLFCSADGVVGMAAWDPVASMLTVKVCGLVQSKTTYKFAFDLVNPSTPQASPDVSIQITGTPAIALAPIQKPDSDLMGVERGANPLEVVDALAIKELRQSNPVVGQENILTLKIQTRVHLDPADGSALTLAGLTGAAISERTRLTPAIEVGGSEDDHLIFCDGASTPGVAEWDAASQHLVLRLCQVLLSGRVVGISFNVTNGPVEQASPTIEIYSSGTAELPGIPTDKTGATALEVPGGADPLMLVYWFTNKTMVQATPLAGAENRLTLHLQANVELSHTADSVISIVGLFGAAAKQSLALVGAGVHELFCDAQGAGSKAVWDPFTSAITLTFCSGSSLPAGTDVTLSFLVDNPPSAQVSPAVLSILASGRDTIPVHTIGRRGSALLGVPHGDWPLLVVVPTLTTATIGQSTPLASMQNEIGITLLSNIDISSATITVSGLGGAVPCEMFVDVAVRHAGAVLPRLCDPEAGPGKGRWVSSTQVKLTLCDGVDMLAYREFEVSFSIRNPASAQDRQSTFVEIEGSAPVSQTALEYGGGQVFGIDDGSNPLLVVVSTQIDFTGGLSTSCGDGVLSAGEECEDGNVEDGDGCGANCACESDPCQFSIGPEAHLSSIVTGVGEGTVVLLQPGVYNNSDRHCYAVLRTGVSVVGQPSSPTEVVIDCSRCSAASFVLGGTDSKLEGIHFKGLNILAGGVGAISSGLLTNLVVSKSKRLRLQAGVQITGQAASVTLTHSRIEYNEGGGVFLDSVAGSLHMSACTISGNVNEMGGGVRVVHGNVTVEGCVFESNEALEQGGAISFESAGGSLRVSGTNFTANSAGRDGGAVSCVGPGAALDVEDVVCLRNRASFGRGGCLLVEGFAAAAVKMSRVEDNSASEAGGGLAFAKAALGRVEMVACAVASNQAPVGGGIQISDTTASIMRSRFLDNLALRGGGVHFNGAGAHQLALALCEFRSNVVTEGSGGAVLVADADLNMSESTFVANSASSVGGALAVTGAPGKLGRWEIEGGSFQDNQAGRGGAIMVSDALFAETPLEVSDNAHVPAVLGQGSAGGPELYTRKGTSVYRLSVPSMAEQLLFSGLPAADMLVTVCCGGSMAFVWRRRGGEYAELEALSLSDATAQRAAAIPLPVYPIIPFVSRLGESRTALLGWGVNQATSDNFVAVMTYDSLLLFDVQSAAWEELECGGGYTAAAFSPAEDRLWVSKHQGTTVEGVPFSQVWGLELATRRCHPPDWKVQPHIQLLRVLTISGDGLFLFAANRKGVDEQTRVEVEEVVVIALNTGVRSEVQGRGLDGGVGSSGLVFSDVLGMRHLSEQDGVSDMAGPAFTLTVLKVPMPSPLPSTRMAWSMSRVAGAGLTVARSRIENNYASVAGGGLGLVNMLPLARRFLLDAVEARNNTAEVSGGALDVQRCSMGLVIAGSTFDRNQVNTAEGRGGAIAVQFSAFVQIQGSALTGNRAGQGLAVLVTSLLRDDPLYEPPWQNPTYVTPDLGKCTAVVRGCDIRGNRPGKADGVGALYAEGRTIMVVDSSELSDNEATEGAAIAGVGQVALEVNQCTLRQNRAARHGGGILLRESATAVVRDTLLSSNQAVAGAGVSVTAAAAAVLERCSLLGNAATAAGAALEVSQRATLAVRGSTIRGNRATFGGGVATQDAASLELAGSEVSANVAQACGGGLALNSSARIRVQGQLNVSLNEAVGDGGALCAIFRDAQTLVCDDGMAAFPFLTDAEQGAQIRMVGNRAQRGGGALFAMCVSPGRATQALFAAVQSNASVTSGAFALADNTAGFGPNAATLAVELILDPRADTQREFRPGQVLAQKLLIRDGFAQVVRMSDSPLPYTLTVRLCDGNCTPSSEGYSESLSTTFHGFGLDGVCDLGLVPVPVLWPAQTDAGDPNSSLPTVRRYSPYLSISHEIPTEVDGMLLAPVTLPISRLSCLAGQAYNPPTLRCEDCGYGLYVVDPDQSSCYPCPQGGRCDGSELSGNVDSRWERVGDRKRLVQCPPGHVLVRDEDLPELDQCVRCQAGSYSLIFANYRPVPNEKMMHAKSVTEALTEDFCLPCEIGAVCPGGAEVIADPGYWRKDAASRRDGAPAVLQARLYKCPPDACLGNSSCATGRTGPVCGVCAEGFALAGGDCTFCGDFVDDSLRWLIPVSVAILLVAWFFVSWHPLFRKPEEEDEGESSDPSEATANPSASPSRHPASPSRHPLSPSRHPVSPSRTPRRLSRFASESDEGESATGEGMLARARRHKARYETSSSQEGPRRLSVMSGDGTSWKTKGGGSWNEKPWKDKTVMEKIKSLSDLLEKASISDMVKIIIGFFQVSSSFLTAYEVQWPQQVGGSIKYGSVLRLDLVAYPGPSCLGAGFSYLQTLLVYTTMPPFVIVLLALPMLYTMCRGSVHPNTKAVVDRYWYTLMFWLFIIYPTVSSASLESFNCQDLGDVQYLKADFRIECPSSHRSEILFIWSVLAVLVYPIGIPVLIYLMLLRYKVPQMARQKMEAVLLTSMLALYKKTKNTAITSQLAQHVGGSVGQKPEERSKFRKRVRSIFAAMDKSRSGSISIAEMQEYLQKNAIKGSGIRGMLEVWVQYDADLDGELDEREFEEMVSDVVHAAGLISGFETLEALSKPQLQALCAHRWPKDARQQAETHGEFEKQGSMCALEVDPEDEAAMRRWLMLKAHDLQRLGIVVTPVLVWNGATEQEQLAIDRVGVLFLAYQVPFYYFEVVEMFRKLVMTSVIVFVYTGTPAQLASGIIVSALALIVTVKLRPYANHQLSVLQIYALSAHVITLFYGLMLQVNSENPEHPDESSSADIAMTYIVFILNFFIVVLPVILLSRTSSGSIRNSILSCFRSMRGQDHPKDKQAYMVDLNSHVSRELFLTKGAGSDRALAGSESERTEASPQVGIVGSHRRIVLEPMGSLKQLEGQTVDVDRQPAERNGVGHDARDREAAGHDDGAGPRHRDGGAGAGAGAARQESVEDGVTPGMQTRTGALDLNGSGVARVVSVKSPLASVPLACAMPVYTPSSQGIPGLQVGERLYPTDAADIPAPSRGPLNSDVEWHLQDDAASQEIAGARLVYAPLEERGQFVLLQEPGARRHSSIFAGTGDAVFEPAWQSEVPRDSLRLYADPASHAVLGRRADPLFADSDGSGPCPASLDDVDVSAAPAPFFLIPSPPAIAAAPAPYQPEGRELTLRVDAYA